MNNIRDHTVDALIATDSRGCSIYLNISGEPIAQERHRLRQIANRRWFYNPSGRASNGLAVKIGRALQELGIAPGELPLLLASVKVHVTFGVHNMNKDLDNMIKFILDTLQFAKIFGNDRLVYKIVAEKVLATTTGFTNIEVLKV
jgi:Holliday junction resolvase RusA-like endonuclease